MSERQKRSENETCDGRAADESRRKRMSGELEGEQGEMDE